MVEHDWRNDAACLDEDPELFFPIGESTVAQSQIREAQAVCDVCPVRAPCLAFSLQANVPYGVWGGASPQERSRMRRRGEIVASRGRSSARPRTLRAVDVSG